MSLVEAREVVAEIVGHGGLVLAAIHRAKAGRADAALGYRNWAEFMLYRKTVSRTDGEPERFRALIEGRR